MSSKRRLRRRQCTGKVRHLTEDFARIAVRAMVKTMTGAVGHLSAYRCPFCNGWHIGHTPGRGGRP